MNINVLTIISFILLTNCYFNPIVQSLLNPPEVKSDSNLGLLALIPSGASKDATVQLIGQVKTLSSGNLANPTLTVGSSSSIRGVPLSVSVTANGSGKYVLKLTKGTFIISVTSSAGVSLGSFTLTIGDGNAITQSTNTGANFTVLSHTTAGISETVTLTEDAVTYSIGGMINTPCFVTACNGVANFTITNSINSDSKIITAGAAPQDGIFTLATKVATGTSYNLSVTANDPAYTCSVVANGSGVVSASNVTNISVTCTVN